MSNCILLANVFPYFTGEVFIENELPYLSKAFDNVYIFSIYGDKELKHTRNIPFKNVFVRTIGVKNSKSKYLHYFFRGLYTNNKKLPLNQNLKRNMACIYAKGRAFEIADYVYQTIKNEKIDVNNLTIYSFWFSYQALATWIIRDMLSPEKESIITVSRAHGYDLYWERTKLHFQPYQDISLNQLDYVMPCSKFGRDYLLEKYPWAQKKVLVSRLGTKDYGLNPDGSSRTILTCCTFVPLKRMPLFAEAFCELSKRYPDVKWVSIGDGLEFEKTKGIVSRHGVNEKVEFKGRLQNSEVLYLYSTMSITYFCNISTTEGLPVSIMEALSFGIPVIATDAGGTKELVDSTNGNLIPINLDKEELVRILSEALSLDNTKYLEKRNSARLTWEKGFSADNNYPEFMNMIRAE